MVKWLRIPPARWRGRHKKQTFGHSKGGKRWDDLREQHFTTVRELGSQWKCSAGHRDPKPGALGQPREVGLGGRFKRAQTSVYLQLIHADLWKKPSQYCKLIILQLKIKLKKKNNLPANAGDIGSSVQSLFMATLKPTRPCATTSQPLLRNKRSPSCS